MKKPEISVIVANYNHAQFISQAVNTILNQSFGDFEIIIVDDGSTDESEEVISGLLKEDRERIKQPILLSENKGKWFALNTAIEQATGKFITLQDADDASNRCRLERQLFVLKEFGSYHNLCGFSHCYNQEDMDKSLQWKPNSLGYDVLDHKEVSKLVHLGHKTPGINHYFVGQDFEAHGATCLFYKQLWTHGMKFLPGGMGLRCQKAEDSDFNTKMTLLLQKTSILKEPLYSYRRNTSTNGAWLEEL